jgi:hypothetical protein
MALHIAGALFQTRLASKDGVQFRRTHLASLAVHAMALYTRLGPEKLLPLSGVTGDFKRAEGVNAEKDGERDDRQSTHTRHYSARCRPVMK